MIISLYPYLLRITPKCVDMVLVFFLLLCILLHFCENVINMILLIKKLRLTLILAFCSSFVNVSNVIENNVCPIFGGAKTCYVCVFVY